MNDPWNSLVEVLAGRHRPTPSSWTQRRVHRMCDDAPQVRPARAGAAMPVRPARPEFAAPLRPRLDPAA